MSFESSKNAEKIENDIGTALLILSSSEYKKEFDARPELKKRLEELRYQAEHADEFQDRDEVSHQLARLGETLTRSNSDESNKK